jgi:hypothetical protein
MKLCVENSLDCCKMLQLLPAPEAMCRKLLTFEAIRRIRRILTRRLPLASSGG